MPCSYSGPKIKIITPYIVYNLMLIFALCPSQKGEKFIEMSTNTIKTWFHFKNLYVTHNIWIFFQILNSAMHYGIWYRSKIKYDVQYICIIVCMWNVCESACVFCCVSLVGRYILLCANMLAVSYRYHIVPFVYVRWRKI